MIRYCVSSVDERLDERHQELKAVTQATTPQRASDRARGRDVDDYARLDANRTRNVKEGIYSEEAKVSGGKSQYLTQE